MRQERMKSTKELIPYTVFISKVISPKLFIDFFLSLGNDQSCDAYFTHMNS